MRIPQPFALLVLCLIGLGLGGQEMQVHHAKTNGINVSEGWIDDTGWSDQAKATLLDFAHYRDWGLSGMEGKDPRSALSWVHLRDYRYLAPDTIDVIYDLNMAWPFGSTGNRARFHIDQAALAQGIVRLALTEIPLGLDSATLVMQALDQRVVFRLEMKFWGLVEALMDFDRFHASMDWRLGLLANNIKTLVAGRTPGGS